MKEAMRLHPGVSYPLERLVPEGGAELCGQKLREGTNVGINPVVVHQNREIFGDDAAQFRPERWLEADQEQLKIMERTLLTVSLTMLDLSSACNVNSASLVPEQGRVLAKISHRWRWGNLFHKFYVNLICSGPQRNPIGQ